MAGAAHDRQRRHGVDAGVDRARDADAAARAWRLFYGGLVRAKNLLSVMSQVLGITAIAILSWVLWDYSLAFSDGNWLIGGLSQGGLRRPRRTASLWPVGSERQGDSRARLRRLPDELRGDHRRAGDRRPGRARALLGDDAVRAAVADHRLRAARAHGVGARAACCSSSARSTSPAARWCTSTRASPGWSASASPVRASAI